MTVYVLMIDFGYEGKELLGVYSSMAELESAEAGYRLGENDSFCVEERKLDGAALFSF
jgi:hypothetical protein